MATTLFFLLAIVFILYEIYSIPLANEEFYNELSDFSSKKDKLARKEFAAGNSGYFLITLLYFLWLSIGILMASQWMWFAIILCMSFVGSGLRKILPSKVMKWYKNLDGTATIVILVWVAWSHFHS